MKPLGILTLGAVLTCASTPALGAPLGPVNVYFGMCDASAAVALGDARFAVANDEDNIVRVYSSDQPGRPLNVVDLNAFLQVDPDKPEADFEGATWLDDKIYWITSHGRNKEAKYRESRHRLFALRWQTNGASPVLLPVGRPYRYLLQDLIREPRLLPFRLAAAASREPKARGALNIEGLCATPESHLLIGFRNPIPEGKALLVPLVNPASLLEGLPARFGDPILLDLDRRGIRDIVRYKDGYLIVAGSYRGGGRSWLYRWAGPGTSPLRLAHVDFRGFNPEAIVVYPNATDWVQMLSDDGTLEIDGVPCKELTNPAQRQFRSVRLSL